MKGHIRRRGKSSWEITIDLGKDADGRRLRKFVNVKGKKADAERQLRELLSTLDKGIPIDKGDELMSTFMSRWLRDEVAPSRRPRTYDFYEMMNRLYIEPIVGPKAIKKVSPDDVQMIVGQIIGKGLEDPLRLDQDVRRISGATLSSRALTDGARKLLALYRHHLRGLPPP